MALFLWLIILLAIAWGLADYQLQSRIDREPPPAPIVKPVPVEFPKEVVAPPVTEELRTNPPPAVSDTTPGSERSVAVQDAAPARAVAGRDEE
jgi:hypothetical protein